MIVNVTQFFNQIQAQQDSFYQSVNQCGYGCRPWFTSISVFANFYHVQINFSFLSLAATTPNEFLITGEVAISIFTLIMLPIT